MRAYWLAIVVWVLVGVLFVGVLIPTTVYITVYHEATEHARQHYDSHDDIEWAVFGKIVDALFSAAFWTAVATIAIAWFTWTLKRSTDRLWNAAKDQIAIAEAANNLNREISVTSRRAWVSIEDVKLMHPTKFMEDSIVFRVQAVTKNLGQTPATSVWLNFESYFVENNSENFPDAERRFKAQLREQPLWLGELLFPGKTYTLMKGWADGIEKIKDAIRTSPPGEKRISVTVFIGLSYRIVGDSAVHITYHAHEMFNVQIGTAIQPGQLVDLPRMSFLVGEAD